MGRATVSLDGVPDATLDGLWALGASQMAMHELQPASNGSHVVRIEVAPCSPPREANRWKLLRLAASG